MLIYRMPKSEDFSNATSWDGAGRRSRSVPYIRVAERKSDVRGVIGTFFRGKSMIDRKRNSTQQFEPLSRNRCIDLLRFYDH